MRSCNEVACDDVVDTIESRSNDVVTSLLLTSRCFVGRCRSSFSESICQNGLTIFLNQFRVLFFAKCYFTTPTNANAIIIETETL